MMEQDDHDKTEGPQISRSEVSLYSVGETVSIMVLSNFIITRIIIVVMI